MDIKPLLDERYPGPTDAVLLKVVALCLGPTWASKGDSMENAPRITPPRMLLNRGQELRITLDGNTVRYVVVSQP